MEFLSPQAMARSEVVCFVFACLLEQSGIDGAWKTSNSLIREEFGTAVASGIKTRNPL